jgi:hypothetical protein
MASQPSRPRHVIFTAVKTSKSRIWYFYLHSTKHKIRKNFSQKFQKTAFAAYTTELHGPCKRYGVSYCLFRFAVRCVTLLNSPFSILWTATHIMHIAHHCCTVMPMSLRLHTRVYPKVSGLAAWRENCKSYSTLPIGAVVSLFCESVWCVLPP